MYIHTPLPADMLSDTNREHLDRILHKVGSDYKMFRVEQGTVAEMKEEEA